MKTGIEKLALAMAIVAVTLVTAATVSGGPASASSGASITLSKTSDGSPAKALEPAAPAAAATAVAPSAVAPQAAPADGVDRVGQIPYKAPNADVPEAQRAPTGDVTCPGKEPCGP